MKRKTFIITLASFFSGALILLQEEEKNKKRICNREESTSTESQSKKVLKNSELFFNQILIHGYIIDKSVVKLGRREVCDLIEGLQ